MFGKLYSFIKHNISIPFSFMFPIVSIIFPSNFFPFDGCFIISTKTFWLFFALPIFFLEMNISVDTFFPSGITNPKFLFLVNVPTTFCLSKNKFFSLLIFLIKFFLLCFLVLLKNCFLLTF